MVTLSGAVALLAACAAEEPASRSMRFSRRMPIPFAFFAERMGTLNLHWRNLRQARSPTSAQAPMGRTGIPFTRNCVLDTITRSPAFSPEETEYVLPTVSPSVTAVCCAT
jgi:hypothetical protein